MTQYIFFNPETLEIKCHSDIETAMELPYIETELSSLYLPNWKVEKDGSEYKLVAIKNQYTDEEWQEIINPPL